MKTIILASLFCAQVASAQTFIDQVDGGTALVCSNDTGDTSVIIGSGNWICKPVSLEALEQLGWTDVEGLILIEETIEEEKEETTEEAPGR